MTPIIYTVGAMAFTAPPAYQALPNQEPNTEPLGETTAQPARGTISPGAAPLSPPPAAQQASSQDSKSADTSVSQSAPVQYTAVSDCVYLRFM